MISPELPERTADMAAKQKLTFPILWDEQLARSPKPSASPSPCPTTCRQVYLGFGNDLAVRNGDPSWRLPVPARFVSTPAASCASVQADPDYTYRPEPETTLEALRKVVG